MSLRLVSRESLPSPNSRVPIGTQVVNDIDSKEWGVVTDIAQVDGERSSEVETI